MKFKFEGDATIIHLGARKEGAGDEKDLAIDAKFQAKAPAAILDLLGDSLVDFLFLLPGGAVRNPMLGPLTFAHEIEGYRLDMLGAVHHGCKVKKISAEPIDGAAVMLTFGVSFKPSGTEMARMAEYLQDSITIGLGPSDGELDLGAPQ